MKTRSCLTLILGSIIFWQTKEISRIAAAPASPFDRDFLRHVSPIEWKNIILYGEIKIDPVKLRMSNPYSVFQHESGQYPTYAATTIGSTRSRAMPYVLFNQLPAFPTIRRR